MDAHRPSKPGGTRQEKAEVQNISSEFLLVFFVSRCDQNMFLPSAKRPEGRAARDTRQARQRLASIFKAVISDSENQVEQLCKLPCLTLRPIFTWGGSGPDNVLQKLPSYSFYLSNPLSARSLLSHREHRRCCARRAMRAARMQVKFLLSDVVRPSFGAIYNRGRVRVAYN